MVVLAVEGSGFTFPGAMAALLLVLQRLHSQTPPPTGLCSSANLSVKSQGCVGELSSGTFLGASTYQGASRPLKGREGGCSPRNIWEYGPLLVLAVDHVSHKQ